MNPVIKPASEFQNPREQTYVGTVQRVSQKDNRYGITFDDGVTWFNGFGTCPVEEGEMIEFSFEENEYKGRMYNNIKKIKDIIYTGETPKPEEKKAVNYMQQVSSPQMINENDMKNRMAQIMKCTVELNIARKSLTDEEIAATFKRLIGICGLQEDLNNLIIMNKQLKEEKHE